MPSPKLKTAEPPDESGASPSKFAIKGLSRNLEFVPSIVFSPYTPTSGHHCTGKDVEHSLSLWRCGLEPVFSQTCQCQAVNADHDDGQRYDLIGCDGIVKEGDGKHHRRGNQGVVIELASDTSICARRTVQVSEGRSFAVKARDVQEAIRLCVSHEANEERLQLGLETVAGVLRQKPNGFPMVI